MSIIITPVESKSQLTSFIKLPWEIYKGDKNWVPPLIKDLREVLVPRLGSGAKDSRGEYVMFLASIDNKPVGRIFLGIDNILNTKKNSRMGYFSLFECINNHDVAKTLFDQSMSWFKARDISLVRGPVSPTGADSDEYKGLLINSFDRPPVVMNSYNPQYYINLMEQYGFTKDYDVFAYLIEPEKTFSKDPSKIIEYAKKKFNFTVDTFNMNNIEQEVKAIKYILDLAIPDEWPDLVAPSLDEVREMAKKLIPLADPDIIVIARSGDEPVGFGIAIPDYNQVLIHLNGRITPLAALKFLWYRKKITCARFFIMFVIPAFRKKGVSHAIYYQTFMNGLKKGYKVGEGSTIGETNYQMRKDIESCGGQHYKTYRIFKIEL